MVAISSQKAASQKKRLRAKRRKEAMKANELEKDVVSVEGLIEEIEQNTENIDNDSEGEPNAAARKRKKRRAKKKGSTEADDVEVETESSSSDETPKLTKSQKKRNAKKRAQANRELIESEQSLEMQSEEEEEQEEEKPVTMSFMELRERIKVNPEMGAFLSMTQPMLYHMLMNEPKPMPEQLSVSESFDKVLSARKFASKEILTAIHDTPFQDFRQAEQGVKPPACNKFSGAFWDELNVDLSKMPKFGDTEISPIDLYAICLETLRRRLLNWNPDRFEKVTVPAGATLVIIGDLHGQFDRLLEIMKRGTPSENLLYLFNGDMIDRGNTIPTFYNILLLKLMYPNHVFLNCGNHELMDTDNFSPNATIWSEVTESLGDHTIVVHNFFKRFLNTFAFFHIINDKILVSHAGPPLPINTNDPDAPYEFNLSAEGCQNATWSDPQTQSRWLQGSPRGDNLFCYGTTVVEKVLEKLKLRCLVRSHVEEIASYFDNRVIGVHSSMQMEPLRYMLFSPDRDVLTTVGPTDGFKTEYEIPPLY